VSNFWGAYHTRLVLFILSMRMNQIKHGVNKMKAFAV